MHIGNVTVVRCGHGWFAGILPIPDTENIGRFRRPPSPPEEGIVAVVG